MLTCDQIVCKHYTFMHDTMRILTAMGVKQTERASGGRRAKDNNGYDGIF